MGFAQDAPESIAKIVVGFDGSGGIARGACDVAHALARTADAQLHVVAVAHRSSSLRGHDDGEDAGTTTKRSRQRLDEALAGTRRHG